MNTLGDFPAAMRETAREENVEMIDLNVMSKTLFEALEPEKSARAFVHYPLGSFPGQEKELKDDTHFSNYGAYQLAKCIVQGLKNNRSGLSDYLLKDLLEFDPSHPDAVEFWDFPHSPLVNVTKPDGN